MYYLLWTERARGGRKNYWMEFDNRDDLVRFIWEEGLQNNNSALVFTPDAVEIAFTAAQVIAGRD